MRPETYGSLSLAFKNLNRSRSSRRALEKAQKHIARAERFENRSFDILKRWNQSFWVKPRIEEYLGKPIIPDKYSSLQKSY